MTAIEAWWVGWPRAGLAFSRTAFLGMADGHYLTAWRIPAVYLPTFALSLGLMVGWRPASFQLVWAGAVAALGVSWILSALGGAAALRGWGVRLAAVVFAIGLLQRQSSALAYNFVFTESLVLICLIAVLGVTGGCAGSAFVAGFLLGDFILGRPEWGGSASAVWSGLWRVRLPLMIQYALVAMLAVGAPLLTKYLVFQLFWPQLSRRVQFLIGACASAATTALLIYVWTNSVPLLIRPVFTWQGGSLRPEAIQPVQKGWWIVILCAVAASLIRSFLQARTASDEELSGRIRPIEEALVTPAPPPALERIPLAAGIAIWAGSATLLFAGVLESLWQAVALFLVLALVHALRRGAVPIPLEPWRRFVEKYPLLLRLVVGLLIVREIASWRLEAQWSANSFRPLLLVIVVSSVLFLLLYPPRGAAPRAPEQGPPS
ncbi:MAG: hypothetical protein KIT09_33905 [Bryobacteraceae bacterium]|nr:hypothetical protein [Bryobacteraceae bacterium]